MAREDARVPGNCRWPSPTKEPFEERTLRFAPVGDRRRPQAVIASSTPATVALLTRERFCLRRTDDGIPAPRHDPDGKRREERYEREVCTASHKRPMGGVICSLCLSDDVAGSPLLPARTR